MKTLPAILLVCGALLVAVNAQVRDEKVNPNAPVLSERSIATGTGRDGFFVRDSRVYMVRNGVTTLVEREIDFPNGVRVLPNCRVTLRDGQDVELLRNQWLNFQGTLEDYAAIPPPPPVATSKASREAGISDRDGVTISGTDVFITRNGVTTKVLNEVRLSNGVIAKANGTILLGNGKRITLRPDQVLGLDGILREAPVRPSPPGVEPSSNRNR
jgi:hypothetical protein